MTVKKLFGIAGSGKTTKLVTRFVEAHRKEFIQLQDMLVLSFTVHAADWFLEKARALDEQYGGGHRSFATAKILTIHKMAWRIILTDEQRKNLKLFTPPHAEPSSVGKHKQSAIARLRIAETQEEFDTILASLKTRGKDYDYENLYNEYMELLQDDVDYERLLKLALENPELDKDWKLVIVDEVQDLSPIQWSVLEKHILPRSKETWLAGDITQSIFRWRNAVPHYVSRIEGEEIFLTESHRVPENLVSVVRALEHQYEDKRFVSNLTAVRPGGSIKFRTWYFAIEYLKECTLNNWPVLFLSLTNSSISRIQNDLIRAGVLFVHAVNRPWNPWAFSITESDYNALRFLNMLELTTEDHGIWDEPIRASIVRDMLKSSIGLSERFRKAEHPEGWTTLRDVFDDLGLTDKNLSLYDLYLEFFGWPPRSNQKIWGVRNQWGEHDRDLSSTMILQYRNLCYQGLVEPTVKVSTIHAAKGLEAERVVLFIDPRTQHGSDDQLQLIINAICRSSNEVMVTCFDSERERLGKSHPLTSHMLAPGLGAENMLKLGIWGDELNLW